jgi:hypothetical protein
MPPAEETVSAMGVRQRIAIGRFGCIEVGGDGRGRSKPVLVSNYGRNSIFNGRCRSW